MTPNIGAIAQPTGYSPPMTRKVPDDPVVAR